MRGVGIASRAGWAHKGIWRHSPTNLSHSPTCLPCSPPYFIAIYLSISLILACIHSKEWPCLPASSFLGLSLQSSAGRKVGTKLESAVSLPAIGCGSTYGPTSFNGHQLPLLIPESKGVEPISGASGRALLQPAISILARRTFLGRCIFWDG